MATDYYFWRTSKSEFAKREGKYGLLMHAPIPTIFSLRFTSFFLSFSPFFYSQFLTTLLPWVVPYLIFSFLGSLSLGDSLFLSASLRSFLFSFMATSSFYSELIQQDFSFLPLGLHQLFLVCCGHPFRITHQPINFPDHCYCSVHVCCTTTHFTTKFPFVCSCCIPLPLGSNG